VKQVKVNMRAHQARYITEQDFARIRAEQLRNPRLYFQQFLALIEIAAIARGYLFRNWLMTTFLIVLYYVFNLDSGDLAGNADANQRAADTLALLKQFLTNALYVSGISLGFIAVWNPSFFKFKSIFEDDLLTQIAMKLEVSPNEIESLRIGTNHGFSNEES
jgi:hypothetical protein